MSNRNQMDFQEFEFKYIKTGNSKIITVDLETSMEAFINSSKTILSSLFEVENPYIVEAGQFYNSNGRDAEFAPALEPSNITVKNYFNKRLTTTSFYVRDN